MKKFKTFRMFISAAKAEIKETGVVCVGWQLQNESGEQENCFHYFVSSIELTMYLNGLKGIEYAEIHNKDEQESRIYFF